MNGINDAKRPPSVTEEKPAKNLASLVNNNAIDKLCDTLIHQWTIRKSFDPVQQYNIRPIDKALFFGPPGNGKTMAAQMIAKKIEVQLFRVRCESLIESALGGTESNMSNVMRWLSKAGPSVVLFDECEAIFPQRNSNSDQCSKTIVRSMQIFWQELDRWESPQMFLMATNRINDLDDALLSRIELKLEFVPPTREQAIKVVAYWAETLHEYGAEDWAPQITAKVESGEMPESFRELWQWISAGVRLSIVAANS